MRFVLFSVGYMVVYRGIEMELMMSLWEFPVCLVGHDRGGYFEIWEYGNEKEEDAVIVLIGLFSFLRKEEIR